MSTLDDMVRRLVQHEHDAIEAACVRAAAVGCGVKVTRSVPTYALGAEPYSITSTVTIEVCSDVPAGEVHEHQGGEQP
jgi:hypothetical protein